MTKLSLLSAALIMATAFTSQAFAQGETAIRRHAAMDAYASVPFAQPGPDHRVCVRAPNVGAFASDPYTVPPCLPYTAYWSN
jgi:hypothetical protein